MSVSGSFISPELFSSRWLVCPPDYYGVEYEINPWMSVEKLPDIKTALFRLGAWVEYIHQKKSLPDMVFTANGGLVVGKKVALPHFRPQERQGEVPLFREWFEEHGYSVFQPGTYAFEGEGDALFVGSTLVGGYGMRSDQQAYSEVAEFLGVNFLKTVELVDPRFYHLDTCFCPLNDKKALIFLPAFSEKSRRVLEKVCELIPIPESDAQHFACNSVVLGQDIVIPAGAPTTEKLLQENGFKTWPVQLDQFLKAGGAAKCLSLRIDRQEV
jgi:N-dimethylarginine dimethylaminohydrolase